MYSSPSLRLFRCHTNPSKSHIFWIASRVYGAYLASLVLPVKHRVVSLQLHRYTYISQARKVSIIQRRSHRSSNKRIEEEQGKNRTQRKAFLDQEILDDSPSVSTLGCTI